MPRPTVSERTFYPPLMKIIGSKGGRSVSEVQFNSVPDIVFDLDSYKWILSVKIGETPKIIKEAFLQYLRHKEESGIGFGMVLLLPESIRKVRPTEKALNLALAENNVTILIDAGDVKEEFRDRPFSNVMDFLIHEVLVRLSRKEMTYYSLRLVISLLQEQVSEMMEQINLEETKLLSIITDRKLLSDLGHLTRDHAEAVGRFLGSYIFLSQVLFLRLFATTNPNRITVRKPASHRNLRHAFRQIREINYRPIYKVDVLDTIDQKYLKDTFDLLWGLEVERVRYELPGRIFHELMPHEIRKMLASFYTRPHAADLLAQLTISESAETLFDPSCGSGTILTSGYKRKLDLWKQEGKAGNPHKRFCEEDIFGADIMPFAVHLTSANLAAMEAGTIIERTQIIQGDSLRLKPAHYPTGIKQNLFPEMAKAETREEEYYDIDLGSVDTVLMNPPFTKVERGIRHFVDMETFKPRCGGEVGLWGHFVILADAFLKDNGTYGAVIPINILRGRESKKVRKFLFENWTPLYVLKPTYNYGFSEWSEYRDILFIAQKRKPPKGHKVKFCLVRKDLTKINDEEIIEIAEKVKTNNKLRGNDLVDIDSFSLSELKNRFENLMWFCGVTNFSHRDAMVDLVKKVENKLTHFPYQYFREGYRPVPKGVSQFLFLTRNSDPSRVRYAFLRFDREGKTIIKAQSPLGAEYRIQIDDLTRTLRTSVGLSKMDITEGWDYICHKPYKELQRVCRAARQTKPKTGFWAKVQRELDSVETNLVVSHRINPFSPATCLNAFFSSEAISPSNQLNVILEKNADKAKSVCVLLNSIIFFVQFFLLKEESTGRYINIRFYDLEQMLLYPPDKLVAKLIRAFDKYGRTDFKALCYQFDENFDHRYEEFWAREKGNHQGRLFTVLDKPIKPSKNRITFDMEVCKTIGVDLNKSDITKLYEIIVKEMITIKGLKRD